MAGNKHAFLELLQRSSAELHADHPELMDTGQLIPTSNQIDEDDVALFYEGCEAGLIRLLRGGRFNTVDRPTAAGRWGLLSRSRLGGWYNAEYLPQLAAYVDAILHLGYPPGRVLFELPTSALQLDLAILDDNGRVVVLGEAKRDALMLETLRRKVEHRYTDSPPDMTGSKDEARQLAWRLDRCAGLHVAHRTQPPVSLLDQLFPTTTGTNPGWTAPSRRGAGFRRDASGSDDDTAKTSALAHASRAGARPGSAGRGEWAKALSIARASTGE